MNDLPENEIWALRASNVLRGICQAMQLNRDKGSPISEIPLRIAAEEATLFFCKAQQDCGRETKMELVFFLQAHPDQADVALKALMPQSDEEREQQEAARDLRNEILAAIKSEHPQARIYADVPQDEDERRRPLPTPRQRAARLARFICWSLQKARKAGLDAVGEFEFKKALIDVAVDLNRGQYLFMPQHLEAEAAEELGTKLHADPSAWTDLYSQIFDQNSASES